MEQTTPSAKSAIGVYVHIPFCQRKCRYCDFYSVTDLPRIPDFMAALQKEMHLSATPDLRADTLRF